MLTHALLLLLAVPAPQANAPEMLSVDAHSQRVRSVAFSTAGGVLTTGDDWTVRAWDQVTGAARWNLASGPTCGTGPIALCSAPGADLWVRGGQELVDDQLVAYAAVGVSAGGAALATWHGAADEATSVALSDDGTTVVLATRDWFERPERHGRVLLWRWAEGPPVEVLSAVDTAFHSVEVNADGSLFVAGRSDGAALLFRGPEAEPQVLGRHHGATIDMDLSADGAVLATTAGLETALVWSTLTGELLRELRLPGAEVRALDFGATGRLALGGSRRSESGVGQAFVEVWELEAEVALLAAQPDGEAVLSLDHSDDGSRLAAGLEGGKLRLWDLSRVLNALRIDDAPTE